MKIETGSFSDANNKKTMTLDPIPHTLLNHNANQIIPTCTLTNVLLPSDNLVLNLQLKKQYYPRSDLNDQLCFFGKSPFSLEIYKVEVCQTCK